MKSQRLPIAALVAALAWVGCGPPGDGVQPPAGVAGSGSEFLNWPTTLSRRGPLGSLRDLVLFDRSLDAGGPFFLDRFEATRSDWAEFAACAAGVAVGARPPALASPYEAVLPMAGVDLGLARAFAGWRRCRLPRTAEWEYASTAGGRRAYPWGQQFDPARANTAELRLGATLPVGTFESGRDGSGPYDLIGNVAEWTETVPGSWFRLDRPVLAPMALAVGQVRRQVGLSIWSWSPLVMPAVFVAQSGSTPAPRQVLGAHFLAFSMDDRESRSPSDYSDTLGIRLSTTPRELLLAVSRGVADYAEEDLEQLRRFLARGRHADVMRAARRQLELDPVAVEFLDPFLAAR